MKRLLRYVAIAVVIAIVGGCIYLNRLLPIITGYAAKNLASAVFVSGREAKDVEALDLNFSFIRYTSNRVDYENKTVTSRFLWGKSTAVYREGCGVTLLCGATADELRGQRFPMDVLSEGQGVQDSTARAQLPVGDSAVAERLAPIAKAFVVERAYKGHPFAFVVVHKGGVVAECYDKGIGRDTKLLSWSMAKSFVNALAGIMVKDSLLDIYAPTGIAGAVFEQDMSGTPVGSSYLYATALDYARFGQLYLDDGCVGGERILPEGWVDYTRKPAAASEGRYGSFFWLNRCGKFPDVPKDMFYCDGHDGQDIFIFPSHDLVVVVLGYSPKPSNVIDFNGLLRDVIKVL